MTTFQEEFLGCRFQRDKVRRAGDFTRPVLTPRPLQLAPPGAERIAGPQAQLGHAAPRGLSEGSSPSEQLQRGLARDRFAQQLQQLVPAVALSVVAAVQPQIAELEACAASLRQEAGELAGTEAPAGGLDPSEVAEAVIAVLAPRFEELERRVAAAAAAAAAGAPQPGDGLAGLQDMVSELVQELSAPLEASIGEALQPHLHELGRHLGHAGSPPRRLGTEALSHAPTLEEARLPSQMLKRSARGLSWASNASTQGRVRRQTSRSKNRLPPKAFVVNFRRLVDVQKILAIIHEFIRSTAIATLTLVAASNWSQLTFSIAFVTLVLVLFAVHEMRHDGMDIEDYKSLIDLLEDDNGERHGKIIDNPNRLLKGLSLSRKKRRRRTARIIIVFAVVVCLLVWINICWSWSAVTTDDLWLGVFDGEDRTVQASLLLVGTMMIIFHISYEWLYWRETQCVMPFADGPDGGQPLDPREHSGGVPFQYRWFGLPSMWFTSRQAYDDLRLWITLCRFESDSDLVKIRPEEMALLALNPDGASYLRRTLFHAKLFSTGTWEFLARDVETGQPRPVNDEDPEELGIEFVLFDRASEQFLQPEEDYRSGLMRFLTRSISSEIGSRH